MPVLALAIVVEARAIMRNWVPGHNRAGKRVQGFLWGASLLVYAFAESACFRALAGEHVWSGWAMVIQQGINLGMGTLVVAPAIEFLVRSNARAVVRLSRVRHPSGFLLAIQRRRQNAQLRRLSEEQAKMQVQIGIYLQRIDMFESWIPDAPDERLKLLLAEIPERRATLLELQRSGMATRTRIDALLADAEAKDTEFRRRRKELLAQAEADLERWHAESSKPLPDGPDT
jgi:hypothetical protein